MSVYCEYQGRCSGCPWLGQPFVDQEAKKQSHLRTLLDAHGISVGEAQLSLLSPKESRTRDRVDLSFRRVNGKPQLGLYHLSKNEIVDITNCVQMTEPLEAWFKEFRQQLPPLIEKASIRLRVSPQGQRGVWLDMANVDVKNLLDEKHWLQSLLEKGIIVEIGQRYKPLITKDGELKLSKKIVPRPWFQSYKSLELTPVQLFGAIGSFTQVGFELNKELVKVVLEFTQKLQPQKVMELFSGLGNFTIPLASICKQVVSFELEPVSKWSLKETLSKEPQLSSSIHHETSNLYAQKLPAFESIDLLVVDPPRSGLKGVADAIKISTTKPRAILYISCFAETLVEDIKALESCGYVIDQIQGVDQFPQSSHCEWICLLKLSH